MYILGQTVSYTAAALRSIEAFRLLPVEVHGACFARSITPKWNPWRRNFHTHDERPAKDTQAAKDYKLIRDEHDAYAKHWRQIVEAYRRQMTEEHDRYIAAWKQHSDTYKTMMESHRQDTEARRAKLLRHMQSLAHYQDKVQESKQKMEAAEQGFKATRQLPGKHSQSYDYQSPTETKATATTDKKHFGKEKTAKSQIDGKRAAGGERAEQTMTTMDKRTPEFVVASTRMKVRKVRNHRVWTIKIKEHAGVEIPAKDIAAACYRQVGRRLWANKLKECADAKIEPAERVGVKALAENPAVWQLNDPSKMVSRKPGKASRKDWDSGREGKSEKQEDIGKDMPEDYFTLALALCFVWAATLGFCIAGIVSYWCSTEDGEEEGKRRGTEAITGLKELGKRMKRIVIENETLEQ